MEFLIKRGKQNQAKETKQTKNKVKRKEVEDSPCEDVLSLPGNGARKRLDATQITVELVGEPQEEGMMSTAASFPSVMKPRFNRTSRSKETPQRCY